MNPKRMKLSDVEPQYLHNVADAAYLLLEDASDPFQVARGVVVGEREAISRLISLERGRLCWTRSVLAFVTTRSVGTIKPRSNKVRSKTCKEIARPAWGT